MAPIKKHRIFETIWMVIREKYIDIGIPKLQPDQSASAFLMSQETQ